MHKFEKKVLNTIKEYKMLEENETVVVGFSGGADSTALLTVLKNLGYNTIAAHINHCLRGKEADLDQEFAREFCQKNNIEFYAQKTDVKKYAKENHLSEEEAGRVVRYAFFEKISADKYKIAVAHNKSDSVETSIFNFIRGSSLSGLKGISHCNNNVVRPLIKCTRFEIEEYLEYKNLKFVTDKSNFENVYSRNRIRNVIIKEMQKINPSVIDTVFENSKIISDENDFINEYAEKKLFECATFDDDEVCLDLAKIKNEHIAVKRRIVLCCAKRINKDFSTSSKNINTIISLVHGKCFSLPNYGLTIFNNYDILHFKADFLKNTSHLSTNIRQNAEKRGFKYQIYDGTNVNIVKIFDEFNLKFDVSFVKYDEIEDFKSATYICVDKISQQIFMRNRQNGDRISIKNVGTKKIKDIFIDKKISAENRRRIPIIESENMVLSVFGLATSEACYVLPNSKKILKIKLHS